MATTGISWIPLLGAGACIVLTCVYMLHNHRKRASAVDLSNFQLEKITKVMDSEMCVVGTLPGSPDKVLLILQKQKFGRGDALRLIHGMTLRRVHENDVYSNHIGVLSGDNDALRVTMIYPATPAHIAKHTEQGFHMAVETKEVYERATLPYIESIPTEKIQWVYNILDRKSETEKIILEDLDPATGFVLLPDTKWNPPFNVENLYCLALVMDKSIRSVRDLRAEHLALLRNLRDKSLALICEKYNVAKSSIRCFVHYQPSYYHFHVHFTHLKVPFGIFVGKAILLEDIIYNISTRGDYYQHATLSYVVGEAQHAALHEALVK
ncbi:unnamed protein product [Aphanomyces euteiches]|uniref:m7GpppX diphosphatase n=1 Tax=Aphanomyces euteiches TaxID=100861 RepID=A0A6G0WCT2_9STRA|nr:hypothetical protein Ae201684_016860 [Aphanomyces euteiches]KAH9076412.1 hypothetical protein Ae201684P_010358 [Aphanomyces euteiches]